ncbi:MAG: type II secretion system protein [Candidatus Eisenbacteria bacterium]|nr:type II secretion system protein [Candidatus Eisenbacteria bacterium]
MTARPPSASQRGTTLVELMIALVVLTLGILAVGQLFPAGSRGQLKDRMTTAANYYAQEQIEQLRSASWSDPGLAPGTHPASGYDTLGTGGQWRRTYVVSSLPAPLDNLKRVDVTVSWTFMGSRSVTTTTYVRR